MSERGERSVETDEQVVEEPSPFQSTTAAIKRVIKAYAPESWLRLPELCEATGISTRTLQRQLSAEGKKYSEIVGEIRAELAASLLIQTNASLSEIAQRVGYSDLSNFNRAFTRWAATSPRGYRELRTASRLPLV